MWSFFLWLNCGPLTTFNAVGLSELLRFGLKRTWPAGSPVVMCQDKRGSARWGLRRILLDAPPWGIISKTDQAPAGANLVDLSVMRSG